jgi:hypothetical protein
MILRPRSSRIALAAAALAALCACGKAEAPSRRPPAEPAQTDYVQPPEADRAVRTPVGATLSGAGAPEARIRLAAPDGSAIGATVSAAGQWTAPQLPVGGVRLLSLSEDVGGRLVRAIGYVALLPEPGPAAVVLRPGAGARSLEQGPRPLSIAAIDFDRAGAAIVSGRSAPSQPVRLFMDGAEAGEGHADARGFYAITLSEPLKPTAHALTVHSPAGQAGATFDSSRSLTMTAPPFAAARQTGAWRIDWISPGGGVQTTLVFDPPGEGR